MFKLKLSLLFTFGPSGPSMPTKPDDPTNPGSPVTTNKICITFVDWKIKNYWKIENNNVCVKLNVIFYYFLAFENL